MPTARIHRALSEIPAADWDALHDGRNPFVAHAFLSGLETTGCLREDWGWTPCHIGLREGDALVAAAPGYLKTNSHGEFVFDHAWAHAHERHGLEYFPKWLGAVPYSPVSGPRLLARDESTKHDLLAAIEGLMQTSGLSSAHVNFLTAGDDTAFNVRWSLREDIQYHWHNGHTDETPGWADFDAFLAAMDHKHRKNIRQERAKVARAGVTFRIVHGDEATEADLAAMHGFYRRTFDDYGNSPALTLPFFRHLAQTLPHGLVLILAELDGAPIAGAFCLRGGETLYGRYWGASRTLPGLHFETCYYQGIEYCLREGLTRFEPGAQGRHKIARGFLPTLVRSRHLIADPRFAQAIDAWCAEERAATRHHLVELQAHSPFRAGAT